MTRSKSLLAITLLLALGSSVAGQATEVDPVGQTMSGNLIIDGVAVPAGTTLLDPSVVVARKGEGYLRLEPGQSLVVAPGSQAVLQTAGPGRVRVAVTSGSVAYRGADGGEMVLAENSAAVISKGFDLVPKLSELVERYVR